MKISAGRVQTMLRLAQVLSADGPQTPEGLTELMPYRSPGVTVGLIDDAISIGESIGLLKRFEAEVAVSPQWEKRSLETDSDMKLARAVLSKVVRVHFPELIAFSFLPIRKIRNEIDDTIRGILDDARLLEVEMDSGAREWWESLRSLGQFEQDDSKKKIGTDAEILSVEHEISFLEQKGVPASEEKVVRVAEQNDAAGFDVLSVNVGRDRQFETDSPLQIEVKVGRKEDGNKFSVMFTRHEHRVMASAAMAWVMHVWLYKPGLTQFEERPINVLREDILALTPKSETDFEWESARFTFHRHTA